jgi:hypothetical protein
MNGPFIFSKREDAYNHVFFPQSRDLLPSTSSSSSSSTLPSSTLSVKPSRAIMGHNEKVKNDLSISSSSAIPSSSHSLVYTKDSASSSSTLPSSSSTSSSSSSTKEPNTSSSKKHSSSSPKEDSSSSSTEHSSSSSIEPTPSSSKEHSSSSEEHSSSPISVEILLDSRDMKGQETKTLSMKPPRARMGHNAKSIHKGSKQLAPEDISNKEKSFRPSSSSSNFSNNNNKIKQVQCVPHPLIEKSVDGMVRSSNT